MAEVRCEVTIDRPIEDVFNYINRPDNDPEWQPEVLERKVADRLEEGTELTIRREVLGRTIESKARVVDYDPPHKSISRSFAGPLQFEGGFHLQEVDSGTRVEFRADVNPTGAYEVGAETFADEFEDEIAENLNNLKEALEA